MYAIKTVMPTPGVKMPAPRMHKYPTYSPQKAREASKVIGLDEESLKKNTLRLDDLKKYCKAMKSFPPELKDKFCTAMGLKPNSLKPERVSWDIFVNVSRIAAALPPREGRALRAEADEVTKLAKLVRTETTLGQRLLQFAKNAQSGIDAEVIGAASHEGAAGYDRRARNDNGPTTAGRLVDGRM